MYFPGNGQHRHSSQIPESTPTVPCHRSHDQRSMRHQVAIPGSKSLLRGPGRWAEWVGGLGGPGRMSDRENTSLRGDRVAIGPREHVTSRGPGRHRTGKYTSLRGLRVALGLRKHVTSKGPGHNWTEKLRHFDGSGSQSDREGIHFTSNFGAGRHRFRENTFLSSGVRGRRILIFSIRSKTRHFEEDPGYSKGGTTGFARKVQNRIVGLLIFNMKSIPSNSEPPPGEPGRSPRGVPGAAHRHREPKWT